MGEKGKANRLLPGYRFKEEFFCLHLKQKVNPMFKTLSIGSINWDDKEVSEQNSIFILCSFHIYH